MKLDLRPGIHVLSVVVTNSKGRSRLVLDGRKPFIRLGDDFWDARDGSTGVINKSEVLVLGWRKVRKVDMGDVGKRNGGIVDSSVARKMRCRVAQKIRLCGVVDDGFSLVPREELEDKAGVGDFKTEHLRDESGAAEGVDGDYIGVCVSTKPVSR